MISEPKKTIKPPLFIEVVADATHQGKTTIAQRIRDHAIDSGIATTYVRIE